MEHRGLRQISESRRVRISLRGLPILFAFVLATFPTVQAQTFQVLHTFTGKLDGANPEGAGLTMDRAGNLYGAAAFGGLETQACSYFGSCGTVFKLSRKGSGWIFSTLYLFNGGSDGNSPDAPIAFGPDGLIYGTTFYGGVSDPCDEHGCGIIYSLRPAPTSCQWRSAPGWKLCCTGSPGGVTVEARPSARLLLTRPAICTARPWAERTAMAMSMNWHATMATGR